ncbi:MAG: nucleotidyltransferase family protein [Clostridiales bacterium]|nr:nucleotidyltransferase family protein [Clostridiales bacterium]
MPAAGTIQRFLLQHLAHAMPPEALGILLEAVAQHTGLVLHEDLAVPLLALLRTRKPEDLYPYPGMGEGLAQRLHEFARRPEGQDNGENRLSQLVESAMSRRLPRTRVQRALLNLLLNLTASDLEQFDAAGGPAYIRVLGFDKSGRYLLKLMRQKASLPLITRGSDFHEHLNDLNLQRQAQFDLAAPTSGRSWPDRVPVPILTGLLSFAKIHTCPRFETGLKSIYRHIRK